MNMQIQKKKKVEKVWWSLKYIKTLLRIWKDPNELRRTC